MAEGSVECVLEASADAAWAAVGDFSGVDAVFPDLDSFEMDGDDRIIGMFGLQIRERLYERDEATRTLVYGIIDGVPVTMHRGTITVTEEGAGSKVTWAWAVEPDEMSDLMAASYTGALDALKKHLGES